MKIKKENWNLCPIKEIINSNIYFQEHNIIIIIEKLL